MAAGAAKPSSAGGENLAGGGEEPLTADAGTSLADAEQLFADAVRPFVADAGKSQAAAGCSPLLVSVGG